MNLMERPQLRHRENSMESIKSVPMWDSSDPDRAPPPLPLNPNLNASPTRGNASATVEAAARALAERARASTGPSPYSYSTTATRSPEKSPTRTPLNRRLQNLQEGTVKDNKLLLENTRPTEWSHSRPHTPTHGKDVFTTSPERSASRADSLARTDSVDTQKDLFGSTPNLRHSSRPTIRSILSESSPRSPTMLAIQNMPHRDVSPAPLRETVNSPTPTISYPTPSNLDAIYTQMQNLTNIATTLQKEMSALSRRSKDNATDLISLKEATNSRDEDIRKSLRDLVTNVKTSNVGLLGAASSSFGTSSRPTSLYASHAPQYLDHKPYASPPMVKSTSLPQLDYPSGIERSTSPYSLESAASVAMLEKIIREMVTKDGQERLLSALSDMLERASKESSGAAQKMSELLDSVQQTTTHQRALVKRVSIGEGPPHLELDFEGPGPNVQGRESTASGVITKELQDVLQKIKDSISSSGGMTGEVKTLVRELRGEVLGMGREIGRKLEEIPAASARGVAGESTVDAEQIRAVVQEGLSELKEQMEEVMQTKRRQSTASVQSRMTVENSSVYAVVKHALGEHAADSRIDQAAVLEAVKEAYEAYKPEIELQQFGLERDEILQCLKEGLDDYQTSKAAAPPTVTRDEVLEAVQEALQQFHPPAPITEATELKEELLATVKECLEEHAASSRELVTASNTALTGDQVATIVKTALEEFPGAVNDEVLHSLHDILAGMHGELQDYSTHSTEHNEQILGALSTGLESLRADVAAVAEHGSDALTAETVNNTIKEGLEALKDTLSFELKHQELGQTQQGQPEVVATIKAEFEHILETLATQRETAADSGNEAALSSIHNNIADLKTTLESRGLDEPMEEITEAIKADFDQFRDSILNGTAAQKGELIETLQEHMDGLKTHISDRGVDAGAGEVIILAIKNEFDALKESMAMSMMPVRNLDDEHDNTAALKQALQDMRAQLSADQNEVAADTFNMLKEELENLRTTLGNSVAAPAGAGANLELLEAIRDGLDGMRNYSSRSEVDANTSDALDSVRDELEQLREAIEKVPSATGSSLDTSDTLEAIRSGVDQLNATIVNSAAFESREVLEMVGDSLEELKADIGKLNDKPVDMTASYETLDLLKSGHSAILFEIERVREAFEKAQETKGSEVVLADRRLSRDVVSEEARGQRASNQEDIEKLEVMLAQLQIKIEAMDQNVHSLASTQHTTTTLQAIANLEAMLEVLQATVAAGAHRGQTSSSSATKEDTDAIEVLLLNTKARLEDEILPAVTASITKDDLDNVEALVRVTGENVDTLVSKLGDNLSTKEDIANVGSALEDVSASLRDVQTQIQDLKPEDSTSQAEFAALQTLCAEMRDKLDTLPAEGQVTAKADLDQVTELVEALQLGVDKLHGLHENDIEVTAKAFDDRKTESQSILAGIEQLKAVVEESKDELKSRLKRGTQDVRALDEILQAIEERMDASPNAVPKVEELTTLVKDELERAHGTLDGLVTGLDAQTATILEKHDDSRNAIVADVVAQLDARLEEQKSTLMQAADSVDLVAKDIATRNEQQSDLLSESKAMSDELKLTIDTLGASIMAINPSLAEATEKMSDDSRTVFNKIEQIHAKMEADQSEAKDDHELTRAHLAKSLTTISLVREQLAQDHPQVIQALTSLLALTGEHFEHSKQQFEQSKEQQTRSFSDLHTDVNRALIMPRLDAQSADSALPASYNTPYDDRHLQNKLDDLLKHAASSEKNTTNSEKLDHIHEQVMSTAAEVSAFVAFQTKMITAVHDNKEEEAKEAAVNLSRNVAESQQLAGKIVNLQDAKDNLAADIEALMAERDTLTSQKMRLTAEVSSLHTALEIRREELEMMDERADALHRRIVEGVMNQSRALLLSRSKKTPTNMNLKRVGSNVSRATDATATQPSLVSTGIGMALKEQAADRRKTAPLSAGGRRIVSLGTTTGNTTPGGSRLAMSRNVTSGPISLKRVQSIKNPRLRDLSADQFEYNKENGVTYNAQRYPESSVVTTSSQRSASYAGSFGNQSVRSASYGAQPSEYSYGTGSYLTGSELSDRRTSYGFSEANTDRRDRNSVGSTIQSSRVGPSEYGESIYEEEEEEEDAQEHEDHPENENDRTPEMSPISENPQHESPEQQQVAAVTKKEEMRRPGDSDSGLGSDLPTAALSVQDFGGYFPSKQKHELVEN